jgi:two-component system, chemotaxis family, chemotaxis protein CheY
MAKRHCLIVDDSDVIRRVLRHMLGALRFDVSEAVSAADAIAACDRTMPDAILLDWSMPGASTLEALHALRRMPGGHAPVIIYCPIENDPVDIARARAAGANDVLFKPFTRVELQATLAGAGLV